MKSGQLAFVESKRQPLLGQLKAAEASLRGSIHARGLDVLARAHLERALSHVNEAYIAINEAGRARPVAQLVDDLVKIERLCDELRLQPPPGITVTPLRV